jgi:hypothetical protein
MKERYIQHRYYDEELSGEKFATQNINNCKTMQKFLSFLNTGLENYESEH